MTGLITGHCHLKGRLLKLGLVDSPGCDRCRKHLKRPHMFLVIVKLWRYLDLGTWAGKWGDFAATTASKELHFVQIVRGCRMLIRRVAEKIVHRRGTRMTGVSALYRSTLLFITTGSLRKITKELAVSRTAFMFCCILTAPATHQLGASRNTWPYVNEKIITLLNFYSIS
jgi:hypothetical protein